ncbi:Fibrocystin-L [Nowakowskiella sp. JEL0078]|nr:Fibrocystin-L [Nowakowskiella sp. JEL0078]
MRFRVLLAVFTCLPLFSPAVAIDVISIAPNRGSLAGGTEIKIYGSNFASDYFTTSVQVFLFADTSISGVSQNPLRCNVIPFYSTSHQIVCITSPLEMDVPEIANIQSVSSFSESDTTLQLIHDYRTAFSVSCNLVILMQSASLGSLNINDSTGLKSSFNCKGTDNCSFYYDINNTPVLVSAAPSYLTPNITGNSLIASISGSFKTWDISDYRRVYFGPSSVCNFLDNSGVEYGISWSSNGMSLKCEIQSIGQISGSVIPKLIIPRLGNSAVYSLSLSYDGGGSPSLFTISPFISSVIPEVGSPFGWSEVIIQGVGLLPQQPLVEQETLLTGRELQNIPSIFSQEKFIKSVFQREDGKIIMRQYIQTSDLTANFDLSTLPVVRVGGNICALNQWGWVSVINNSTDTTEELIQEIRCTTGTAPLETTKYQPGSKGILVSLFEYLNNTAKLPFLRADDPIWTQPNQESVIAGGFDEISTSDNNWVENKVFAKRYLMYFIPPITSNYTFYLSTSGMFSPPTSMRLILRENVLSNDNLGKEIANYDSSSAIFKSFSLIDKTRFTYNSDSISHRISLTAGELIGFELQEWITDNTDTWRYQSAGMPTIGMKIYDLKASNTASTTGSKWNWIPENTYTTEVDQQQISISVNNTVETQLIRFTLTRSDTSVDSWINVDGRGWNANSTYVTASWGGKSFFFSPSMSADDVKSNFINTIMTSQCQQSISSRTKIYGIVKFEVNNLTYISDSGSPPEITSTTSFCGQQSLYFQNGNGRATILDVPAKLDFLSGSSTTTGFNIYDYPYFCMAYKIPIDTVTNMIIDIENVGRVSLAINAHLGALADLVSMWDYPLVADWNSGSTFEVNNAGGLVSSPSPMIFDGTWRYQCLNIRTAIDQKYGVIAATYDTWTKQKLTSGGYQINKIAFESPFSSDRISNRTLYSHGDFWIDNFAVSSQMIGFFQTSAKAVPNGVSLKDISITRNIPIWNKIFYTFQFIPNGCPFFIPKLSVTFNQTTKASATNDLNSLSSNSLLDEIHSGTALLLVSIYVNNSVSRPMGGWWTLSFGNFSIVSIPAKATSDQIQNLLWNSWAPRFSRPPFIVTVSQTCYSNDINIQFRGFPGDQPLVVVNSSRISGNNPSSSVTSVLDGGLFISPISSDMLRAYVSKQKKNLGALNETVNLLSVDVGVSGIGATCAEVDCRLYSVVGGNALNVPSIESFTPTQGKYGDIIKISGSKFQTWSFSPSQDCIYGSTVVPRMFDSSNLTVFIGDSECSVNFSNDTYINCILQSGGKSGNFSVKVIIPGFGISVYRKDSQANDEFYLLFGTQDISPMFGSTKGNTILTVFGWGFSSIASEIKVYFITTVEDAEVMLSCKIIFTTSKKIECLTPSLPDQYLYLAENNTAIFDVYVELLNPIDSSNTLQKEKLAKSFTFSTTLTPQISEIFPSNGSVFGGDILTIQGNYFGYEANNVEILFGEYPCNVLSVDDNTIECITTESASGIYSNSNIYLNILGRGAAKIDSSIKFSFELSISGISENKGSILGGQTIQILGNGFCSRGLDCSAKNSFIEVFIGDLICNIVSVNYSCINCITPSLTTTWMVNSSTINQNLGIGNEFNSSILTIRVGDWIEFNLGNETQSSNDNIFQIAQVGDENSTDLISNGFQTSNNISLFQFNYPGKYYFINEKIETQRGVIKVLNVNDSRPWSNFSIGISVFINGNLLSPSIVDNSIFQYTYVNSLTPVIDNVTSNGQREFQIFGRGFINSDSSTISVYINGTSCVILNVYSDYLSCLHPYFLPAGYYIVKVIGFYGVSMSFIFENSLIVSSSSPNYGTLGGGLAITLTGNGFNTENFGGKNLISITDGNENITNCQVLSSTTTELKCLTSQVKIPFAGIIQVTLDSYNYLSTSIYPVPSYFANQMNERRIISCNNCSFSYDQNITPIITSISPQIGISGSNITIMGQGFGSDTKITLVLFNTTKCLIYDINDNKIVCNLGFGIPGLKLLNIFISGKGKSIFQEYELYFQHTVEILSLTPMEGSVLGGTEVYLRTSSEISALTSKIMFNGLSCVIIDTNITHTTCLTSSINSTKAISIIPDVQYLNVSAIVSPSASFKFSLSATPKVENMTNGGKEGDILSFSGINLFANSINDVFISINKTDCPVISVTDTLITCRMGQIPAYLNLPVDILIRNKGFAQISKSISSLIGVTKLSGLSRGSLGGGTYLNFTGYGFSDSINILICKSICKVQFVNYNSVVCVVPKYKSWQQVFLIGNDEVCQINLKLNEMTAYSTFPLNFTYIGDFYPNVIKVNPVRGSSNGGDLITIYGANFGNFQVVTINGIQCEIQFFNSTVIQCVTGSSGGQSGTFEVKVLVNEVGSSIASSSGYFQYADVWSNLAVWSGKPLPKDGDTVVIPPSQTLMLDIDSPNLMLLLIQGTLIFDNTVSSITLSAKYIFIHNGGKLQIGTEYEPYHKLAKIRLLGSIRDASTKI